MCVIIHLIYHLSIQYDSRCMFNFGLKFELFSFLPTGLSLFKSRLTVVISDHTSTVHDVSIQYVLLIITSLLLDLQLN